MKRIIESNQNACEIARSIILAEEIASKKGILNESNGSWKPISNQLPVKLMKLSPSTSKGVNFIELLSDEKLKLLASITNKPLKIVSTILLTLNSSAIEHFEIDGLSIIYLPANSNLLIKFSMEKGKKVEIKSTGYAQMIAIGDKASFQITSPQKQNVFLLSNTTKQF